MMPQNIAAITGKDKRKNSQNAVIAAGPRSNSNTDKMIFGVKKSSLQK